MAKRALRIEIDYVPTVIIGNTKIDLSKKYVLETKDGQVLKGHFASKEYDGFYEISFINNGKEYRVEDELDGFILSIEEVRK